MAARCAGGAAGERNQIQLVSLPFTLFMWPWSAGLLRHAYSCLLASEAGSAPQCALPGDAAASLASWAGNSNVKCLK